MKYFELLLIISIVELSCNYAPSPNINSINSSSLQGIEKVDLNSLVNDGISNNDDRITLGNVKNLDIIYGFRKLKLNTKLGSLSFRKYDINDKYKSKGILIVHIKDLDVKLFGDEDELLLTFYNNQLTKISIFSGFQYLREAKTYEIFNTSFQDLKEFFGPPTKNLDEREFAFFTQPEDRNNPLPIIESFEWRTKNVIMTYHSYLKIIQQGENKFLTEASSSISYSLLENEKILLNTIKSVNENNELLYIQQQKELQEQKFRKKF